MSKEAIAWALAAPVWNPRPKVADKPRKRVSTNKRKPEPAPVQTVHLPPVPPEALLTLVYLATREQDGVTWVSAKKIAEERGLWRGPIYRHLTKLEEAGYVTAITAADLPGSKAKAYAQKTTGTPRIWRLNYAHDDDVSQHETQDAPQHETRDVSLHETPKEVEPESELEGEAPAMPSEIYREYGGQASPPASFQGPKPFPKQCDYHQRDVNYDKCGKCGAAREAYQEAERAKAEASDQQRRANARMRAECPDCNDDGLIDTSAGVARCKHPNLASLKGAS